MGKYIYQKKQTMNRIYRLALQLAPVFLVVHMSGVVLVYGKKARKGHCGPKGIKRKRCKPKNKGKNKGSSKGSSKGGNEAYEGTIIMEDPIGMEKPNYPAGMPFMGNWTSNNVVPPIPEPSIHLCDCDGDTIPAVGEMTTSMPLFALMAKKEFFFYPMVADCYKIQLKYKDETDNYVSYATTDKLYLVALN